MFFSGLLKPSAGRDAGKNKQDTQPILQEQIRRQGQQFTTNNQLARLEGERRERRKSSHKSYEQDGSSGWRDDLTLLSQSPEEAKQKAAERVYRECSPGKIAVKNTLNPTG